MTIAVLLGLSLQKHLIEFTGLLNSYDMHSRVHSVHKNSEISGVEFENHNII